MTLFHSNKIKASRNDANLPLVRDLGLQVHPSLLCHKKVLGRVATVELTILNTKANNCATTLDCSNTSIWKMVEFYYCILWSSKHYNGNFFPHWIKYFRTNHFVFQFSKTRLCRYYMYFALMVTDQNSVHTCGPDHLLLYNQ